MTRARTQAAMRRWRDPYVKSCAASTCRERVSVGRIFCPNHWFFLPKYLRDKIISTHRDAAWAAHQDAIRSGADFIDREKIEARENGFTELVSAREGGRDGRVVRYAGRML